MRIGILTFWWSNDNYGQLLQCYALQKFLRDAGHDVFLIRYNSETDIIRTPLVFRLFKAMNPIKLWRFIVFKTRVIKSQREIVKFPRHFEDFRSRYIAFDSYEYNSYADLKLNPPNAELYIVGSDQVWNFFKMKVKKMRNAIHAYFLDFGDERVRRISYAASWGRVDVPRDQRNEIKSLIKKFDFITVRELSGVDVCRSFGMDAEWVCDPTLLLDAEEYRGLYRNEGAAAPNKPYLLFYYLDNGGKFDKKRVWEFARAHNLEVQYVSGNLSHDKYKKNFATITDWLVLVDNAEYVVTNSFHCCVFSILFGKQFGAIRLTGINREMNERLSSLFNMTGCGERYVVADDFSMLKSPLVVNNDFAMKRKSKEILDRMLRVKE